MFQSQPCVFSRIEVGEDDLFNSRLVALSKPCVYTRAVDGIFMLYGIQQELAAHGETTRSRRQGGLGNGGKLKLPNSTFSSLHYVVMPLFLVLVPR